MEKQEKSRLSMRYYWMLELNVLRLMTYSLIRNNYHLFL